MEDRPNYPQTQAESGQVIGKRRPDLTLRQNIDGQIELAKKRVEELEAIRERIEKTGLLDSRIDDLQQAMRW